MGGMCQTNLHINASAESALFSLPGSGFNVVANLPYVDFKETEWAF